MIVRSRLPWPLRWAVLALALGFSAALSLWAFEVGKGLAGLERQGSHEVQRLRDELAQVRSDRDRAQSIANTAESLMRAERATQETLARQVKALEAETAALKDDLGFFERLLPTASPQPLALRGLQAEVHVPGQLQFQLLLMRGEKAAADFIGRYDVVVSGLLDGRPWSQSLAERGGQRPLQFRQYQRVRGQIGFPPQALVQAMHVRVFDTQGGVKASGSLSVDAPGGASTE